MQCFISFDALVVTFSSIEHPIWNNIGLPVVSGLNKFNQRMFMKKGKFFLTS